MPLTTFTVTRLDQIELEPEPTAARHLRKVLKAYAANCVEAPPVYRCTNAVVCCGEEPARILWRGFQWAVTTYGIECRDGTYAIDNCRLWEEEHTFGWIEHIAEKEWVDLVDFAEALRIARHVHAKHSPRPSQGHLGERPRRRAGDR